MASRVEDTSSEAAGALFGCAAPPAFDDAGAGSVEDGGPDAVAVVVAVVAVHSFPFPFEIG